MPNFTHSWCEVCEKIQLVTQEELRREDKTGKFLGGDLLCAECRLVLLRVYLPKDPESLL
jgi:hypothetical protein